MQFLGAGVAGIALEQAIPLGRVWSFPKCIVIPADPLVAGVDLALIAGIDLAWDGAELTVLHRVIDEWNRKPHYYQLVRAEFVSATSDLP